MEEKWKRGGENGEEQREREMRGGRGKGRSGETGERQKMPLRERDGKTRRDLYLHRNRIFQKPIEIDSVNIQNLVVCISISLNLFKKKERLIFVHISMCP